jgi:hypothetical protein
MSDAQRPAAPPNTGAWTGSTDGATLGQQEPSATAPPAEPSTTLPGTAVPEHTQPAAPPAPHPNAVRVDQLPPAVLAERLRHAGEKAAREAREALLRELEVEDPQAFQAKRKQEREELEALKKAEDERKRAAMSEQQRVQADYDKLLKEHQELETKYRDVEEQRVTEAQEAVVQRVAVKHIDPDMYAYARADFINHVKELMKTDPKKLEEMSEREIERFFRQLAIKRPRLALQVQAPAAPPATPANGTAPAQVPGTTIRRQVPVTTGANPRISRAPAGATGAPAKTARPGQANSMTDAEVRAELRKSGLRGW